MPGWRRIIGLLFACLLGVASLSPHVGLAATKKPVAAKSATSKAKTAKAKVSKPKKGNKAGGKPASKPKKGGGKAAAPALASPIAADALQTPAAESTGEIKARSAPDRAYAVDGATFFHNGRKFRVMGLDGAGGEIATQRLQQALDAGSLVVVPEGGDEAGATLARVRVNGRDLTEQLGPSKPVPGLPAANPAVLPAAIVIPPAAPLIPPEARTPPSGGHQVPQPAAGDAAPAETPSPPVWIEP